MFIRRIKQRRWYIASYCNNNNNNIMMFSCIRRENKNRPFGEGVVGGYSGSKMPAQILIIGVVILDLCFMNFLQNRYYIQRVLRANFRLAACNSYLYYYCYLLSSYTFMPYKRSIIIYYVIVCRILAKSVLIIQPRIIIYTMT